jgi:hypothetical protein
VRHGDSSGAAKIFHRHVRSARRSSHSAIIAFSAGDAQLPSSIAAGHAVYPVSQHGRDGLCDAPSELLHLLAEDAELCRGAIAYLDAAVLHQDTIYSVTARIALFAAAILADARTLFVCDTTLPLDDRERPVRAALLEWLGRVAAAAAWGELEHDELGYARAIGACSAIRADDHACFATFLDDPDAVVRQANLTRVEAAALVPEVLSRMKNMKLAGPVERTPSTLINGIHSMPVRFTPSVRSRTSA